MNSEADLAPMDGEGKAHANLVMVLGKDGLVPVTAEQLENHPELLSFSEGNQTDQHDTSDNVTFAAAATDDIPQQQQLQLQQIQQQQQQQQQLSVETQRVLEEIQIQLDSDTTTTTVDANARPLQVAYHILHDDEDQQIVEIHYQPLAGQIEGSEPEKEKHATEQNLSKSHNAEEKYKMRQTLLRLDLDKDNPQSSTLVQHMQVQPQQAQQPQVIQSLQETNAVCSMSSKPESSGCNPVQTENTQILTRVTDSQIMNNTSHSNQNLLDHKYSTQVSRPILLQTLNGENNVLTGEHNQSTHYTIPSSSQLSDTESAIDIEVVRDTNTSPVRQGYQSASTDNQTICSESLMASNTLLQIANDSLTSNRTSEDYVSNPNFQSQDYYDWLLNFVELCKIVSIPIEVELFQKMNLVHKTLTEVLGNPKGVLHDRKNFKIIMQISKQLHNIINEQLAYVLEQLENSEDPG